MREEYGLGKMVKEYQGEKLIFQKEKERMYGLGGQIPKWGILKKLLRKLNHYLQDIPILIIRNQFV